MGSGFLRRTVSILSFPHQHCRPNLSPTRSKNKKGERTPFFSRLDKNKIYVTHCQLGGRSTKTVVIMKDLGFVEVYNITGGIAEWKSKGLPIVKSP